MKQPGIGIGVEVEPVGKLVIRRIRRLGTATAADALDERGLRDLHHVWLLSSLGSGYYQRRVARGRHPWGTVVLTARARSRRLLRCQWSYRPARSPKAVAE